MTEAKTAYTAAERRAIDEAWWALMRMCERSYKAERLLNDGLKLERRERSSVHAAKALMISSASENWNSRANTLFSFAEGCMMAALAGSEGRRLRKDDAEWRTFKRLARKAVMGHWAAVHRALDRIA